MWPVLPQWSHLGGGTDGGCVAGVTTVVTFWRMDCVAGVTTVVTLMRRTGGGCLAGVTTVVKLRRRDRWWLYGQCYHSGQN